MEGDNERRKREELGKEIKEGREKEWKNERKEGRKEGRKAGWMDR